MDKTVALQLNKGRKVSGTLRGYDQFMNLVLGDAVEEANNIRNNIGIVVSGISHFAQIANTKQYYFPLPLIFFRSLEEIVFYKWNWLLKIMRSSERNSIIYATRLFIKFLDDGALYKYVVMVGMQQDTKTSPSSQFSSWCNIYSLW